MDKKLSFYLKNSNFKETVKINKKPLEIRKSQKEEGNLLKIVNGEICLNDNDMFVNLNREEDMEVYEETGPVTYATFGKKRNLSRWSKQETELFYEAISVCGLEFTLISDLFENKERKSCRQKYLAELKRNRLRVEESLNSKFAFSSEKYDDLKSKIAKLSKKS